VQIIDGRQTGRSSGKQFQRAQSFGGDILTLQQVLRHSSLMTTMRYAHFSPGHLAEVVLLNPLANKCGRFVDDSRWTPEPEELAELAEAG